jgi:DNA repair protein RadA/Sms
VGGLKVEETAADLPLLMAALSSFRDRPLPAGTVVFGEIGLSGEVRPVYNGEERLNEAAKHGFKRAIVPSANAPKKSPKGMDVIPVRRLGEAIDAVLRD